MIKKGRNKPEGTKDSTIKKRKRKLKSSNDAVKFVAKIADERKADYVKVLNVGPRLIISDYFVLISASNTRLTRRISEEISLNLKKYDLIPINVNGLKEGNWVLMDYDDFVIHIFTDEYMEYYNLERLWRDSEVIKIKDLDKKKGKNSKNKK